MTILRRLLLPHLVVMTAGLGLLGAMISKSSVRYVAEFELPVGSLLTFKDAEAVLKSPAALYAYTRARGIADTAEARTFAAQLEKGAAGPIRIEHRTVFTRSILRDVPDLLAANLFKNMNPISTIYVSGKSRSAEGAVREADLAMAFVRVVLVERALSQIATEWKAIGASIPNYDSAVLTKASEIASLERTIAAMSNLEEAPNDRAGANSAQVSNAVQLQVTGSGSLPGSAFLPPAQQIIGFKSKRIITLEELKNAQDELAQAKTMNAIGSELASMMSKEPDLILVLDSSIEKGQQLRANAASIPEQKAADVSIVRFLTVKQWCVEMPTNPPRPNVQQAGISLLTAVASGVLIATALWAAMVYLMVRFGSLAAIQAAVHRRFAGANDVP